MQSYRPEDVPSSSSARSGLIRPARDQDWEPYRDEISQLYRERRLKDVMKEMEDVWHFKATEKQYKTQIKKWGLDVKYTKSSEYMAMLRIKRERESLDPPKETRFHLRGRPVDPKEIARFEKRAQRKGAELEWEAGSSDEAYLADITYSTPSPSPGPRGRTREDGNG